MGSEKIISFDWAPSAKSGYSIWGNAANFSPNSRHVLAKSLIKNDRISAIGLIIFTGHTFRRRTVSLFLCWDVLTISCTGRRLLLTATGDATLLWGGSEPSTANSKPVFIHTAEQIEQYLFNQLVQQGPCQNYCSAGIPPILRNESFCESIMGISPLIWSQIDV